MLCPTIPAYLGLIVSPGKTLPAIALGTSQPAVEKSRMDNRVQIVVRIMVRISALSPPVDPLQMDEDLPPPGQQRPGEQRNKIVPRRDHSHQTGDRFAGDANVQRGPEAERRQ